MAQGCFRGKRTLEAERRPGEVSRAVARAKQGDRQAIRFLYLRYADNIYGYARSIVRNDHDAEDIVQQVFTRMLTAIRTYEERSVPFSAWLLRIAHNMAIDHLRRRSPVCDEPELAVATGCSGPRKPRSPSRAPGMLGRAAGTPARDRRPAPHRGAFAA